jgi:hypothetical protein
MKTPPVRKSVFRLARGTELNTRARPRCGASDEEIQAGGSDTCPRRTKLGRGEADVFLGAAGDTNLNVEGFNGTGELIVVLVSPSSGAVIRVIRAKIRGSKITAVFPRVPLGEFEAALTRFELRIPRKGTARRPWAQTPETCPPTGRLRVSYRAT